MKKAVLLVLATILITGSDPAKGASRSSALEGLDRLSREKGLFKKTLMNPDADFSSYSKLLPTTVMLRFRDRSRAESESGTGTLIRKRSRPGATPDAEDRAKFRQIISEAVVNELERSETLHVVHEAGPGTLILRAAILDLVSKIPSKSSKRSPTDVKLVGEGTIVFDLIDAETGVIQARVSERRKIRRAEDSVGPADDADLWAEVGTWAERATADLCQELERARQEDTAAHTGSEA